MSKKELNNLSDEQTLYIVCENEYIICKKCLKKELYERNGNTFLDVKGRPFLVYGYYLKLEEAQNMCKYLRR